jgi:hypothetical protein
LNINFSLLKNIKKKDPSLAWWIPALRRLRQKDLKFKASLGYIPSPCPKEEEKKGRGGEGRREEEK